MIHLIFIALYFQLLYLIHQMQKQDSGPHNSIFKMKIRSLNFESYYLIVATSLENMLWFPKIVCCLLSSFFSYVSLFCPISWGCYFLYYQLLDQSYECMMSACINSWLLQHVLCNRKNCILSLPHREALRSGGVSYIGVDVILFIALFQVCEAISTRQTATDHLE